MTSGLQSVLKFQQFYELYSLELQRNRHKDTDFFKKKEAQGESPICEYALFPSIIDVCSGWKQQSFKSTVNKITLNGNRPLPLVYTTVDQMSGLSGKKE